MESETKRRRYQIQTKLYHVEDVLVSWGPIRLTLRQCFVLILGGCGSTNLWPMLDGLAGGGDIGLMIRIVLTSFPTLLALGVATVRVADRYAEAWAIVLLWYATHASVYVWLPSSKNLTTGRKDKRITTHRDHPGEDKL
jgi:hypothetical protein